MQLPAGISTSWTLMLLRAFFALLFGVFTLLMPGPTLTALVLIFAAYLLADGVVGAIAAMQAARHHERWGWLALAAGVSIVAGLAAFFWPGLTVFAFVALVGAWALVSGIAMLIGAVRFRQEHGKGWLVLGGLVSVVWGLLLFIAPISGALVMTLWLGAYALVFGVALLVLAIKLRRETHRPLRR
jgi:uncharacterized membrane protein HdeD (DUF308 family)